MKVKPKYLIITYLDRCGGNLTMSNNGASSVCLCADSHVLLFHELFSNHLSQIGDYIL